MSMTPPLKQAIQIVGLTKLARALAVSHQAVRKWQKAGRMPRTEWTGETNYSARIDALTDGKVPRELLLCKWPPPAEAAAQTETAAAKAGTDTHTAADPMEARHAA